MRSKQDHYHNAMPYSHYLDTTRRVLGTPRRLLLLLMPPTLRLEFTVIPSFSIHTRKCFNSVVT